MKDGFGAWTTKDGEFYQGQWINNQKDGPGIQKKKDGKFFVKWYKQGKKTFETEIFDSQEGPITNEDEEVVDN